ncbi:twin-arginine translocase subunit TatB [Devosia sp. MC532]|uniref:Sec-independent protein translocase protein TatB n=1 Tax=Devosia sp. MC532 TaxID=2799788 RepID=UPI0018F79E0E|nr:Sec-independent protein translocase protein TatB [Devosia sp. MC532]MBJ7576626.1 twin-arginine translocase subunit TatB [Devosia sp. MC532]
MLGLSWTEMLVIGVVALIFIGPKDLPVMMGKVGKIIGQIQRMGRDFQREINKTSGLDEVRSLRNSITSPLKQTAEEIRREFNTMSADGPKPSGVIKPADPSSESVVNEIREKAGMPPIAKSNDDLASEYGFKSSAKPEASSAQSADTATAPVAQKAAAPAAEKPTPVKAARPRPSTKTAAAIDTAEKPVKKPRAKAVVADAGEKAPAKPRAPRKKATSTGEKSE